MSLSVIIPAHNEAGYIGACLEALLASEGRVAAEILVVPNGCSDRTAEIARGYAPEAEARGWTLRVIERAEGGKIAALNAADATASGAVRIYLDADVRVDPGLIAALAQVLDRAEARYASGTPRVSRAASLVTRLYARFWVRLPFVSTGVPGFGVFAVNSAGRGRWADLPDIISDDTFVRLSFAPEERVRVPEGYDWPMVEGFRRLVRVRRRQDRGVAEVRDRFPDLVRNEGTPPVTAAFLRRRALADPIGFAVYACVALAVRLGRNAEPWARGR